MLVVKKATPLMEKIITTAEVFEHDVTKNGLIVYSKGTVKPYQTVVSVSEFNKFIKEGDLVVINPKNYVKKKFGDNSIRDDMDANPKEGIYIPTIEIDGKSHFLITDRDIDYIINDYEEVPDAPVQKIILPKEPKIIM